MNADKPNKKIKSWELYKLQCWRDVILSFPQQIFQYPTINKSIQIKHEDALYDLHNFFKQSS